MGTFAGRVLFGLALVVGLSGGMVLAVGENATFPGTARPGGHEFRDLVGQGETSCARCHFPAHNIHKDFDQCVACHVPTGVHVARTATCVDCHDDPHEGAVPLSECTVCHDSDGQGNLNTDPRDSHQTAAPSSWCTLCHEARDVNATPLAVGEPPVADAGGPYSAAVQAPVTLDGSASTDADGTIVSYDWDFGDGTTASGMTLQHSYVSAGTYTVTLTVTDDAGLQSTATTQAVISTPATTTTLPGAPIADPGGPYAATVGVPITFDGSASTDTDGTIVSYTWDFGDGGTATGVMPEHAFVTVGDHLVTLTVTDDAGLEGSATVNVSVVEAATATTTTAPGAPIADAGGPYSAAVAAPITFDGSASTDTDGTIVSYTWDFGDGTSATGVTLQHSYAGPGSYTVTLTVTDDAGLSDTDTAPVTITVVATTTTATATTTTAPATTTTAPATTTTAATTTTTAPATTTTAATTTTTAATTTTTLG